MNTNRFFGHKLWLFLMMAAVWLLVSCSISSTSPQSQISKKVVFIKGLTLQGVDKENGRVTINWRMHRDEEGIDHTLSYKVYVATNDNGVWVEDSSSVSIWRIDGTGDVHPIVFDDVNELKAVDVRVPETNSLVSGTRYQVVVEARNVDDSVVARSTLDLVFSSESLEADSLPEVVTANNELDSTTMIVDWDVVSNAQGYVITVTEDASRLFGVVEVDAKVEVVCEEGGLCEGANLAEKIGNGKLRREIAGLKRGGIYKVMVVPFVLEDLLGLQSVDEEGNEVSFEEEVKRLALTPGEPKPGKTVSDSEGVVARVKDAARASGDSVVEDYTMKVKTAKAVTILETNSSETDIYLAWSHGEGADRYSIILSNEGQSNYAEISRKDSEYAGFGFTTFTGLTTNTSYTVEVISYNSGVKGESASIEITTMADGGSFTESTAIYATNLTLANSASGRLQVSWDVVEEDSVTGYNVFYYKGSKPDKPHYVARKGETNLSFEVEPGEYTVQVDVLGTSVVNGEAESVKVYTTPRVPEDIRVVFEEPKSVEDFNGNLYYSSYDFTFSRAVNDKDAGGFTSDLEYYYSYRRSSDTDWGEEKIGVNGRGIVVAITNDGSEESLSSQMGQEYEIKVIASNQGGFTAEASHKFVFRSFPAPIPFSDLTVNSGDREAFVSWNAPSSERLFHSPLLSYRVVVISNFQEPVQQVDIPANQRSVTITNLENNVEYIVNVFTVSTHGQSLFNALALKYGFGLPGDDSANGNNVLLVFANYFGVDLKTFTPQGHPEPVEGVSVETVEDGGAIVSWDKAATGSPADGYEVDYITLNDGQAIEFSNKTDGNTAEGDYGSLSWQGAVEADDIDVSNTQATFTGVPEDKTNVYRVRAIREGGQYRSEYVYYAKGLFVAPVVSIAGLPDNGVASHSVEGLRMTASVLFDPSSTNQLADFDPGAMVWSINPVSAGYIEVDLEDRRIATFHISNAEVGSVAIRAAVENYEQFKAVSHVTLEKATYVSGEEPIEYPDTFTFRNNGTISKISTTADKRSRYFEKSLTIITASTGGFTWSLNEDGSISVSSSESDGSEATIAVRYSDYNYVDHIETIKVTAIDSRATIPEDSSTPLVFAEHSVSGFRVDWTAATAGVKADGSTAAPITNYVVDWGTSGGDYTLGSASMGGTSVFSYTVANLAVGTQYFVRVRAIADTDDGGKAYSEGLTGNTYTSGPAGAPTLFMAGVIESSSVTLSWVAPVDTGAASGGVAVLSGYKFEYKLTNSDTWTDISATTSGSGVRLSSDLSVNSGATGVTVEGLLGRTAYDFRISAKNSAGLYGEDVSITVETSSGGIAPEDSVNAIAFTGHAIDRFTVNWTAATAGVKADGLTTAPITNYVVEWGTTAGSYPNGGNAGVSTSYTITGLASGTQYFVRVRAVADNDDESKIYSAGKSGGTYVLSVPGVPTSFATGTVTATSIVFTWVAPGDAGTASTGDATLSGYRFEYKLMNNNTWNDITSVTTGSGVRLSSDLSVNSGATGVTVEGLQGRTAYDFRISAKNNAGLYGGSVSVQVSTISSATAPVDGGNALVFDEHQTSGFKVSWSTATAGMKIDGLTTAPITNYVVEWGTTAGSYPNGGNAGVSTSYTITGLASGTQYFVRVRAVADNDDESKIYSAGKSGDTYVLSAPGVPTSFATGTVTATSIVFTWVAPWDAGTTSTGDATLSGYKFEYQTNDDGDDTWNEITSATTGSGVRLSSDLSGDGGATGVTVEGLRGGTAYGFRIFAKNSADLYSKSASIDSVTTLSLATAPVDSGNALVFDEHQTNGFTVSWNAATPGVKADGSTTAPITNYVVEWGTTAGSYPDGGNTGVTTTSYTITGLASGTQYFVRVRAIADNDDESKVYSSGNTGSSHTLYIKQFHLPTDSFVQPSGSTLGTLPATYVENSFRVVSADLGGLGFAVDYVKSDIYYKGVDSNGRKLYWLAAINGIHMKGVQIRFSVPTAGQPLTATAISARYFTVPSDIEDKTDAEIIGLLDNGNYNSIATSEESGSYGIDNLIVEYVTVE